jgi:formylglycine-generating enzyme required for sulfatase activity
MKLTLIPAGEFTMGSPESEAKRERNEGPQHRVKMPKPFYMGVYEVKQSEYEKVMGNNPSSYKDNPNNPVEQVTWDEAVEFCDRLSQRPAEKQVGRKYRLPTEAEWEYACRAGTSTAFHYGNALYSRQANFSGEQPPIGRTVSVGKYQPNAWGLFDMHGNVWEWCLDGPRAYTADPMDAPRGPEVGQLRTLRGGAWAWGSIACRSAFRFTNPASARSPNFGFRVVCER